MAEFTDEQMLAELAAMGFEETPEDAPQLPQVGEMKETVEESNEVDDTDSNMWVYDQDGEKITMDGDFFNNPDGRSPQIQQAVVDALKEMNFIDVSRTQHSTLPIILSHFNPTLSANQQMPGNHCIIQGPAGTGKTMAFILGSMSQIDRSLKKPQVLVIANTQELVEQNQQQADFFAWKSEEKGNQVLFAYKGCNCEKGIANDQHTCQKTKESRFGDRVEDEIETRKLVGKMKTPWRTQVYGGPNGGLNPNFKAQYVSLSEGVVKDLLKKPQTGPEAGKFTKVACEFLSDVRVVIIDEADKVWSRGGINGLANDYLNPICAARNQGKKKRTKKDKEALLKTQFIFVSATFRPEDRTPLRDVCKQLKDNHYGMDLKEVYLSNKDLLLKKVKQYYVPCDTYDSKYMALYTICKAIQNCSKSVLIIPMGEETMGGTRQMGQNTEMDRIYDFLMSKQLQLVDRFSASRAATPEEKNDRSVRKNKHGRVACDDQERTTKMAKFKNQDIKYMVATSMDRGINIKACTHVILFGMATKAYANDKIENEYLQRIGRCGRAGTPGCAVVLINRPEELAALKKVEQDLDMAKENMSIRRACGWSATDQGIVGVNGSQSGNGDQIEPVLAEATQEGTKEWWTDTFLVHSKY